MSSANNKKNEKVAKIIPVECPSCKKKFNYHSSQFRPFCSERCKMVDLGLWLTEHYAVPSQEPPTEKELEELEKAHEEHNRLSDLGDGGTNE